MMDDADYDKALREAPHNLDAEQALLGAILINNDALHRVSQVIEAHQFHEQSHGRLFDLLKTMIEAGQLASLVTVKSHTDSWERINEHITASQYLGRLAANATTIINAKDYARTIRDLYDRRALILIGEDMVNAAYDSPVDANPKEQISQAEERLYALAEQDHYGKGSRSIHDIFGDVLEDINAAVMSDGKPQGLTTGFADLDLKLGPLAPGNLIILAGRPSMGKTALALNIASNIAKGGTVVQFDSMEMSSRELGFRLLADFSGVPSTKLKSGDVSTPDLETTIKTSRLFRDLPLFVDDAGGLTIGKMAARARRIKRTRKIGCLVVDYLQLMAGKGTNRVNDVTEITTGLKALAKDLEIPIIALSQLSRAVEQREDKRPQLSDLRESGSIEQDADVVLFVYREQYYVERQEPTDLNKSAEIDAWRAKLAACTGKAEVIIGKQRHGPVGTVKLAFDASLTRFSNLAYSQSDVPPHKWQERDQ